MTNGIRQDSITPYRHPLPGETVVDKWGQEYVMKTRGQKFWIMMDGSCKAPGEVRLKEPAPPPEKKLTRDEEFSS